MRDEWVLDVRSISLHAVREDGKPNKSKTTKPKVIIHIYIHTPLSTIIA